MFITFFSARFLAFPFFFLLVFFVAVVFFFSLVHAFFRRGCVDFPKKNHFVKNAKCHMCASLSLSAACVCNPFSFVKNVRNIVKRSHIHITILTKETRLPNDNICATHFQTLPDAGAKKFTIQHACKLL